MLRFNHLRAFIDLFMQAFVTSLSKCSPLQLSRILITCEIAQKPVQSYQKLLSSVREILNQYEQVTQLSSSHLIVRALFLLLTYH